MKQSIRIGRIAGIDIYVHFTLFIVLIIFSYALYITPHPFGFYGLKYSSNIRAILSVISAISLFLAVLLHELSHSLIGKRMGVKVKGIILFIFGGVALLEKIPEEPRSEIKIAVAGPLMSIFLASVSLIIYLSKIDIISELFLTFSIYNFALAFFNLIPAFPLDGGRILRALIARKTGFLKATKIAAEVGKILAFLIGILGLFFNPWLILIAFFIYMGASEEEKSVIVENILKNVTVREIMTPSPITVTPAMKVSEVLDMMLRYKHLGYPVVDDGDIVGIITLKDIMNASPDDEVEKLMSRDVLMISPSANAIEALQLMNERNIGRLPVVENGKLVGIVSRTDLIRTLEILGTKSREV
ncbi:Zn-dependent protease [Archaeoglobus sulfaticallidus PM70-1]|uniref:Zinc metalloprotease n=1 Tax=Archaeoglobus sulfaticallidus PM70-1 TaxID=387631 RepID=N0BFK4_9EURY|nr:M50 family metallopeptidase [Archaeoglobus sulfaticallidus]AGK61813.1 Zn-dependent protease [Archaeoglobus sulfaticallidus PM70-1]